MKNTTVTRMAAAAVGGALFLSAGFVSAGTAGAEPSDGRVDLQIGTAGDLDAVPIAAASQIAAGVCDREVSDVTPVAQTVDTGSAQQLVCNNTLGAIEFSQNDIADDAEDAATEQQPDSDSAAEEPATSAPTTSVPPTR